MRLPVALVQLDAGPDPDANVRRAAELADRAADTAPSAAVAGRT